MLLAALPLALFPVLSVHIVALALGTLLVKAFLLPRFLSRAIREASVRREIEPLVGFTLSVILGAAAVALAFGIARHLALPGLASDMLVPVALSTVIIGLLVLTTRNKALTQVVGYLILENGIYVFGLSQALRVPFLVEVGVLLDIFAGVFIMGIVVFHINREFDSLDSARLTELKD
jgi:hydrogenase-4 component E